MPPAMRQEIRDAFEQIRGLPFPIYAGDSAGNFLFVNEQAAEFFALNPALDPSVYRITTYYENPEERAYVLRRLQEVAPGAWCRDIAVRLKVHDEFRKIRFVSKPFRDAQGNLCGLLCIALSMSDIEWFAEFEEMVHTGFFEVDRNLVIADCNQAFARVLKYGSPAEIKGQPLANLFWEPRNIALLADEITKSPHIEDRRIKLRRKDGAMVIVQMSCIGHCRRNRGHRPCERYHPRRHVRDHSARPARGAFPGQYRPERRRHHFARQPNFCPHSRLRVVGRNSVQTNPHVSPQCCGLRGVQNRTQQSNRQWPTPARLLHEVQDRLGKKHNVVANVRYVSDENHHLRVGAVYDVTDHLRGHTRTLEADFSSILHTYIATINGLRDTMTMLLKAHGEDLQKDETHLDRLRAAAETLRSKKRLETLLAELLKTAAERGLADDPSLARMSKLVQRLALGDTSADKEKDNAALGRRILLEFRKQLDVLRALNLPREPVRNLRAEVEELLRLTSMISLSISLDELNERIPDFYYFRDYLRRGELVQQEFRPNNVVPILLDSVHFLEEFAAVRQVSVVLEFNQRDHIPVLCHRNSLNRAFHNLLHNAIKYSWNKGSERRPWVTVRIEKKDDTVEILIENWGVPIRREELESRSIFQFGKRGRESEDRGRSGTGIGLYDAHDIISKHGGSLRITSEPTFGNLPDMYSNPFITRTYITLPVAP
jgi:signal transduction histidine kinase/PAS domain-containing protein